MREHTRIRTWYQHGYNVLLYPMSYVYAHAVGARPHPLEPLAGLEPAALCLQDRCTSTCA